MIHCIGDSHVNIFENQIGFVTHNIKVIDGLDKTITASHIRSFIPTINEFVADVQPDDYILFSAGEVDVRCFFENKIEYYKDLKSKDEIIDGVVMRYFSEIYQNYGGHKLIFYGPVPSYHDKNKNLALAQLKNAFHMAPDEEFFATGSYTNRERNEITRIFNKKLKYLCDINSVNFFTMFYNLITEDGTTNFGMYGSEDGCHIDKKYVHVVIDKLLSSINYSR